MGAAEAVGDSTDGEAAVRVVGDGCSFWSNEADGLGILVVVVLRLDSEVAGASTVSGVMDEVSAVGWMAGLARPGVVGRMDGELDCLGWREEGRGGAILSVCMLWKLGSAALLLQMPIQRTQRVATKCGNKELIRTASLKGGRGGR